MTNNNIKLNKYMDVFFSSLTDLPPRKVSDDKNDLIILDNKIDYDLDVLNLTNKNECPFKKYINEDVIKYTLYGVFILLVIKYIRK